VTDGEQSHGAHLFPGRDLDGTLIPDDWNVRTLDLDGRDYLIRVGQRYVVTRYIAIGIATKFLAKRHRE
jgi:hypothetical protein